MRADPIAVEVHFIPISSDEAEQRRRRLDSLFLTAARRIAQQNGICGQEPSPDAGGGILEKESVRG